MCRQRAGCNALPRGMCRQRAGCNPGTAKADGQRAWWQLRLECPNNRALCAGKGQVALCCWGIQASRLPAFKRLKPLKPSKSLVAALLPRSSCHQALWPSASAVPGLQPALCLHIPRGSFHQAPGRQRSSIAACPLPAHSPLLFGHSSLPFARLQTLKTLKTIQLPRGSFHQALWPSAFAVPALQPACPLPAHSALLLGHSSLPFASLQTLKTLKTIQPSNAHKTLTTLQLLHCFLAAAATIQPSNAQNPYNPPTAALLPRGSCYQALWLSAFAVPGLQPALCLHTGCNAGTAKADGQRAWWKLPRGSWMVLRVLSV